MTTRLRLPRRAGRLEPVVSELTGKRVVANDSRPRDAWSAEARALEAEGATLVAGSHAAAHMDESDVVVVSPGVPPLAELAAAEAKGVAIWGEVELAVRSMARAAPVHTYSGIYADDGYNEAAYVDEVTRWTNTIPCEL